MKNKLSTYVLLSCMAIFLTGNLFAQNASPLINVRIVTVKSGQVDEWVELQRKSAELAKKAGRPGRSVWQEIKGDHNTFHIVSDRANYAAYGEANTPIMSDTEQANWVNSVVDTIQSRQEVTIRTYPDLEVKAKHNKPANYLTLRIVTVKPGRSGDYLDWLEKKLVPALRKHGRAHTSYGRGALGGDINTWTMATRYESWADLDKPGAFAGLSQAERDAIFDRDSDMVEKVELKMFSFREDLSYEGP